MNEKDHPEKIRQIIAKTWVDEDFKQRLLLDPVATLNAEGLEIPAGLEVRVVENTDSVYHLVLPAKPTDQWKRSMLWINKLPERDKGP